MPSRRNDEGCAHFLTFGCYHHFRLFCDSSLCSLFLHHLDSARKHHAFKLYAWVVMPNHVHLLLMPDNQLDLSSLLISVKRLFSYNALGYLRECKPTLVKGLTTTSRGQMVERFWQHGGGYDRVVDTHDEVRNTVNYIHNNPVRKRMVHRPEEYPWSSAAFWIKGKGCRVLMPDVPEWW